MARAKAKAADNASKARRSNAEESSHQEDIGLLKFGGKATGEDNGDDGDEDDDLIFHHGDEAASTMAAAAAAAAATTKQPTAPNIPTTTTTSRTATAPPRSPHDQPPPKTPRSANRVRFDLPDLPDYDGGNKGGGGGGERALPPLPPPPQASYDSDSGGSDSGYQKKGARSRHDEPSSVPLISSSSSSSSSSSHHNHSHGRSDAHDPTHPSPTTGSSGSGSSSNALLARLERARARPQSSVAGAFSNMANSIIGAGVIGQAYALRQAGLAAGVLLLVALTATVGWTLRLVVVNSKLSGRATLQGTARHCFGRAGRAAASAAQWAFAFGGMVAFCVVVGDALPGVLARAWAARPGAAAGAEAGAGAGALGRRAVIVVCVGCVSWPLSLYRDIAKLEKASTLALISMMIILVTVVTQGFGVPPESRGTFDLSLLTINSGIFQAIGVISFAFVCHHNTLLIYGSIKTPTLDRFATVTHYSTFVSMVACLLLALSGFLTFGSKTQGNVLNNFPADNTMVNVARFCFGLNMLTTLPLEAFVCREVMVNYFWGEDDDDDEAEQGYSLVDEDDPAGPTSARRRQQQQQQHGGMGGWAGKDFVRHVLLTTALVWGAVFLSLLTCDLGAVFEIIGATSACALAYILPPMCYIKLSTKSWRTRVAWGVVVFGFAVMGISLVQSATKLFYDSSA